MTDEQIIIDKWIREDIRYGMTKICIILTIIGAFCIGYNLRSIMECVARATE